MIYLWILTGLISLLTACAVGPPPEPYAAAAQGQAATSPSQAQPVDKEYAELKARALSNAVTRDSQGNELFQGETVEVILDDFRFEPSEIYFKSGTITRVRLKNESLITHYFGGEDFFKEGAEIVNLMGTRIPTRLHHIPVSPHDTRDLYVFLKEPGSYLLDCFVPVHRSDGMLGTIYVR